MSWLANVLRALVVDPRSQRAMDETLLDAREELARAKTMIDRAAAMANGAAATTHVLVRSFGRECRHLQLMRVGVLILFSLAVPSYLALWIYQPPGFGPREGHSVERLMITTFLSVGVIAAFVPISAFIGGVAGGKWGTSPLALVTLLVLGEIALVGWVVPETNQQFRQRTFERLATPADRSFQLPRGPAEKSLTELARPATALEARQAVGQLRVRTTLVVLTGWLATLGFAARRFKIATLAIWTAGAVLLFVAAHTTNVTYFEYVVLAYLIALTLAAVRSNR